MKKKNMEVKMLLSKVGLVVLPFVVCFAVELFILPIDFFTLRPWETLIVKTVKVTDGPFYPNQEVLQASTGEIAPHSPYAVPIQEHWITDKYGYRNRNSKVPPEVVLIGDSFVAGATLSQDELLSEALERKANLKTFSFAPADPGFISEFLLYNPFKGNLPKTIVFCRSEHYLHNSPPLVEHYSFKDKLRAKVNPVFHNNTFLANLTIILDRAAKWPMYHSLRAKLDRFFKAPEPLNLYQGELFLYGESVNDEVPAAEITRIADIVENYSIALKQKGIRFIFLPVPNKESVYYKLMPSQKESTFLPRLLADLEARGVEVIDLQASFQNAYYKHQIPLYPTDDNHWNSNGVNIAASLLHDKLNTPE